MFRRPRVWIGVLLVAAIGVGLLDVATRFPAQAAPQAQTVQEGMASLLDELWNRVLTEQSSATTSDFTFSITFNTSISGTGNSVTFGQGLNNLQISRIGADHFCISRAFSRTLNVDCIPFSNISRIAYQESNTQ